jgi:hypothetical protein
MLKVLRYLREPKIEVKQEVARPPLAIDKDSKFVYTGGSDVIKTWRKYGWIPPSERKQNGNH